MQIFSRISILFTVFNQIRLKNYQIKTNKIFNFSHKISQKRHFVAQKWQFLCEIRDFSRKKMCWLSFAVKCLYTGTTINANVMRSIAFGDNVLRNFAFALANCEEELCGAISELIAGKHYHFLIWY